MLRDELATHRARSRDTGADAFVFTTRDGGQCDDNHLRTRVLGKAIERANEHRAEAGLTPLPEGLTFHSLPHTAVSALFALGHELPVVNGRDRARSSEGTLGIYAHVMRRGPEAKAALRALVEGSDWAPMGTSGDHAALGSLASRAAENEETPR